MSLEARGGGLVIAPAEVALERFFRPEHWLANCFEVKVGSDIKREQLVGRLVASGYRRTSLVEYPRTALRRALPAVRKFAELEGLSAHGRSAEIRLGA